METLFPKNISIVTKKPLNFEIPSYAVEDDHKKTFESINEIYERQLPYMVYNLQLYLDFVVVVFVLFKENNHEDTSHIIDIIRSCWVDLFPVFRII